MTFNGLKINQDGTKESISFTERDVLGRFENFVDTRGAGDLGCFDTKIGEDDLIYLFFGFVMGFDNFNLFEFDKHNVYGDAFIIAADREGILKNIDMDCIENFFEVIDLDDTDGEDDDYNPNGDTYDYGDEFLTTDEDGIDFEESFSDDDLYWEKQK